MSDRRGERHAMVERQLASRGIEEERILAAMEAVPREEFLPEELRGFAYEDTPLPIARGQTVSQPYIVALMAQAAEIGPDDRVLEIGTGSGYSAAVFAELADRVYTIERHDELASRAREHLERLGYGERVEVRAGDGTLGWSEAAPFDAILVAAGGPDLPEPLLEQLAPGGRLVMPVGPTRQVQELVRVTRNPDDGSHHRESLGGVRFVPLVGEAGWQESDEARSNGAKRRRDRSLAQVVADGAQPFDAIEELDGDALAPLLDRIGDARVVLLGEASHGTSEFYRVRDRITRALVEEKGFTIVAVEADWPDAGAIDRYVRDLPGSAPPERPFERFPTWMWANREVLDFVHWLRRHNEATAGGDPHRAVGFYGLDLYSLYSSIDAVVRYLDDVDPETARVARERYGCLTPWENDPATYGRATLTGRYRECEQEVVAMLGDLLAKSLDYTTHDGTRFLDAVQNARLVANAERYYRVMYYGARQSWNLRDQHMFETLEALLDFRGPASKAVVWEHNSHIGDASATQMGARGEHNVGQLCRERFGDGAYLVGFGTDRGTVAAASDWGGAMETKRVRPAHPRSYERICHETGIPRFFLPLGHPLDPEVRPRLAEPRLERAIGVIYRPETELQSHYFQAELPRQFDEYVWLDETTAVTPIGREPHAEGLETFPFGL